MSLPADWQQVLLLALILVLAHSVETTLGFGATIIALVLGLFLFPLEQLLPVLVMIALLQSTWLVIRWHRHIRWRLLCINILPLAAAGMIAGILLRGVASEVILILLLGLFIMAVSAFELTALYRSGNVPGPLPGGLSWAVLAGGGVFHGLFATGGPLVVYYAGREIERPEEFRATLSLLWLVLNIALLVSMCLSGQVGTGSITLALLSLPGFVAGVIIGSFVNVQGKAFKALTWAVLFIVGLIQVLRMVPGIFS